MTNLQMIITIGVWVIIIIQFLKEKGFDANWRTASILIGGILGFLWWVCSTIPWLNWVLRSIGAQPVRENPLVILLNGYCAGFGATYFYAVIETLLKKIGRY